jgi:hypothetical protein
MHLPTIWWISNLTLQNSVHNFTWKQILARFLCQIVGKIKSEQGRIGSAWWHHLHKIGKRWCNPKKERAGVADRQSPDDVSNGHLQSSRTNFGENSIFFFRWVSRTMWATPNVQPYYKHFHLWCYVTIQLSAFITWFPSSLHLILCGS